MGALSTRQARSIRAGINARCLPYLTGGNDNDGYYTVLDFVRFRAHLIEWETWLHKPLSRRAFERTSSWTSTRKEN